jgi:hypothetical protein
LPGALRARVVTAAVAALMVALPAAAQPGPAGEPAALIEARARYNAGDLDGAITAAAEARGVPGAAHAASLVVGRAYLDRFRSTADPLDLASGREALASIDASALGPADRAAWLVGLGQSLYLGGRPGAAAELFETALGNPATLGPDDARALLDWWASALEREAGTAAGARRAALLDRLRARMQEELLVAPGSAPANYWLAATAFGAGDLEGAWDLAAAGWVRAQAAPGTAAAARADLDRLVLTAIVPALAPVRDVAEETLQAEWAAFKDAWP